ncbi:MAG: fumarylacetoacetate hydrolase family protein [Actinomycetota bacterium]
MSQASPQPDPLDPELAERLQRSRAEGDHFPEWMAGTIDLDTALQLQLSVLESERSHGTRVGGWKVGLTSEASRQALGADERPFGFIRANRTLESPATVDYQAVRGLSIETEMCFTIARDIGDPEITPDRILNHVLGVSAGFELNEARTGSAPPDFFSQVTDCLTNWGIVHGPPASFTDAGALSDCTISMRRNGETVFEGVSRDFVDDHAVSLCRLVAQLARHGEVLRSGQRVITGAFARFPTDPGDRWIADFSGIGSAEVLVR